MFVIFLQNLRGVQKKPPDTFGTLLHVTTAVSGAVCYEALKQRAEHRSFDASCAHGFHRLTCYYELQMKCCTNARLWFVMHVVV